MDITHFKSLRAELADQGLYIKKTRNGNGVFTKRKVKTGSNLFQVKGTVLHYTKINERGGTFQDNTFRFGSETYLSPEGEIADYLNHSCEPNSKVSKIQNKLYIISIADIPKDTEIAIDYSTILADDDIWTMKCNCGSKTCRKVIRRFTKLPKKLLNHYVQNKIIPRYIQKFS